MRPFRILVVDDDVLLNFASCESLKESGFDAVGVHSGGAAFEAVGQDAELSALLTDIDLGAGPNGFDVAQRARTAYPHLPVVFISGTAAARRCAEVVEGAVFFEKPFRPAEIVETLRHLVARNENVWRGPDA